MARRHCSCGIVNLEQRKARFMNTCFRGLHVRGSGSNFSLLLTVYPTQFALAWGAGGPGPGRGLSTSAKTDAQTSRWLYGSRCDGPHIGGAQAWSVA